MRIFKPNVSKMRKKVAKLIKKKDVRGLIKALSYQDWSRVREDAAEALGDIADVQAAEPLIATLKDLSGYVHRCAAEALGKLGDLRAVEPLMAMLEDQGSVVRDVAQKALVKLGPASIELLSTGLNHKERDVQRMVADVLVLIGDTRAVEPLIVHLKQGCVPAATALAEIGDVRAVEPLILALTHKDWYMRSSVARALADIGDVRAVEPLIAALRGKDFDMRESVAEALGKIGDVRAVEPLIGALSDEYKIVRISAAEALGKIGDVRAVEPLIGALSDGDKIVRESVASALRCFYNTNTIDDSAKQKILAVHKDMPKKHTDKHDDVPGVCMFQHGDRHSDNHTEVPL